MSETLREVVDAIGCEPTLARTLSAAVKLDRLAAESPALRVAVLRNITIEPGLPAAVKVQLARIDLSSSLYLGNFDNIQEDVFNPQSSLYSSDPSVIVVALRLQTLSPKLVLNFSSLTAVEVDELSALTLERVVSLLKTLRNNTKAMLLVHNFELPAYPAYGVLDAQMEMGQRNAIQRLNAEIMKCVSSIGNAFLIDIDRMLSLDGYENALDDRYWHIGRAPYTFAFQQRLAGEYVKYIAALKGKNKKCLVLDCDNTLWGGVIGEDGLQGIKLGPNNPGSAFMEFQAAILDLYKRGILLAINSKNNEADALEVFEKHPSSLLKTDHFVSKRINWQDKATNLREIAAELNIGIDSLVFVDDNPFECNLVRAQLPEVTVIQLPEEPTKFARLMRSLPYFDTLTLSDEDRRRSEMYNNEAQRTKLKTSSGSMEDYLKSLGMALTISPADSFSRPRVAQLTQKTNQFNVTTRRYTEGDIQTMIDDPKWSVYVAQVRDKFDDAGIIAVALVHNEGEESRIDTYLMSCRVIGRGVEQSLLAQIAKEAASQGAKRLIGEYIPTPKNVLVERFFENLNFEERPGSERRWWSLDLSDSLPQPPAWFSEILVVSEVAA